MFYRVVWGNYKRNGIFCIRKFWRWNEMDGVLWSDSTLYGYTCSGTTWANEMNFAMNHTPDAGSITAQWPKVHRAATCCMLRQYTFLPHPPRAPPYLYYIQTHEIYGFCYESIERKGHCTLWSCVYIDIDVFLLYRLHGCYNLFNHAKDIFCMHELWLFCYQSYKAREREAREGEREREREF